LKGRALSRPFRCDALYFGISTVDAFPAAKLRWIGYRENAEEIVE